MTRARAVSNGATTKGDIVAGSGTNTSAVLGVGANDTVLTADSTTATGLKWAVPAAGGMTLLSTTTLSGASTTISSISQSYNSLFAVIYNVTWATADGRLMVKGNGVADNASYISAEANGTDVRQGENIYFNIESMGRTNSQNSWTFRIDNYTNTSKYKQFEIYGGFYSSANGTHRGHGGFGIISQTAAITSLEFGTIFTGGNFSTGTVLLYGVK